MSKKQYFSILGLLVILILAGTFFFKRSGDVPSENQIVTEVRPFEERAPRTCDSNFSFFITKNSKTSTIGCFPFAKPEQAAPDQIIPSQEYTITCDSVYKMTFMVDEKGNPLPETCKGEVL